MNAGTNFKAGDIVLANIQFTDTFEVKKRPALVLFEEFDNIVVAGITSNTKRDGVLLTEKDGVSFDSVIRLNYIFTVSRLLVDKKLFVLGSKKRQEVYDSLVRKLSNLIG